MTFKSSEVLDILNKHKNIFLELIEEYDYRYKRYRFEYSVCLIYLPKHLDINTKELFHARETDKVYLLDKQLAFFVFDNTNAQEGIKASENILSRLEAKYFGSSFFCVALSASDGDTKEELISKMFNLLLYAIKNNTNNLVIDINQII